MIIFQESVIPKQGIRSEFLFINSIKNEKNDRQKWSSVNDREFFGVLINSIVHLPKIFNAQNFFLSNLIGKKKKRKLAESSWNAHRMFVNLQMYEFRFSWNGAKVGPATNDWKFFFGCVNFWESNNLLFSAMFFFLFSRFIVTILQIQRCVDVAVYYKHRCAFRALFFFKYQWSNTCMRTVETMISIVQSSLFVCIEYSTITWISHAVAANGYRLKSPINFNNIFIQSTVQKYHFTCPESNPVHQRFSFSSIVAPI